MNSKEKDTDKKQKRIARTKLAVMILMIIAVPCYAYFFHPEWIQLIKNPDAMAALIEKYRTAGMPVYLGLNVIQVI